MSRADSDASGTSCRYVGPLEAGEPGTLCAGSLAPERQNLSQGERFASPCVLRIQSGSTFRGGGMLRRVLTGHLRGDLQLRSDCRAVMTPS